MLLGDALTRTTMWTCTAVAAAKACHVVVNRNRGGSVAIIAEKPLRARGGFFRISQQLTNGQPCFLACSHPGFISSSSQEFNILSRVFTKRKHGFIPLMACACMYMCVCVCVCVQLFPTYSAGLASGQ